MSAPLLRLPAFTGTLEELMLAIRRGQLSLPAFPLSLLTEQVVAALPAASSRRLDEPMEWLELTCRLIHWKSAALLPAEEQAAAETALRDEIDRHLTAIERAYLERLRDFLAARLLASGGSLETPSEWGELAPQQPEEAEHFPSLWSLRQKFQILRQRAQQRREAVQMLLEVPHEDLSLADMWVWLQTKFQKLGAGQSIPADQLLEEAATRPRQIALFLTMLEKARHVELDAAELRLLGPSEAFQVGLGQCDHSSFGS